eukprot:5235849-Prymnesium_polylepis.1
MGNGRYAWDNGYTHAWTQVHAALRPRGKLCISEISAIARRPAFSHGARPRPAAAPSRRAARRRSRSPPPH